MSASAPQPVEGGKEKPPEPAEIEEAESDDLAAAPAAGGEVDEEEVEGMRRRVLELGHGKGKGKKTTEAELAEMVLRLTDPSTRSTLQETITSQASTIKHLQEIAHAQRTYFTAKLEAERTEWEAERLSWQRVVQALGERMRRAEEGRRLPEEVEHVIRALQSDKRALRQQLQETHSRLTTLQQTLDDLRPLLLLKPSPTAAAAVKPKSAIFSPRTPRALRPVSADARAEHLFLAARRRGPVLLSEMLDKLPQPVQASLSHTVSGVPQTPKTPRRRRAPAGSSSAKPEEGDYPDPRRTPHTSHAPQVPQSAPAAPGLEQILSAARELDDDVGRRTEGPYKRRRVDVDVDATPTKSTFRRSGMLEDAAHSSAASASGAAPGSGRERTALDVLAEQAVFGSQETHVSRTHSAQSSHSSHSSHSSLQATPDPGRQRGASLGPAFMLSPPLPPSTPTPTTNRTSTRTAQAPQNQNRKHVEMELPLEPRTPRMMALESDVRREVMPSPAPREGWESRRGKRKRDVSPPAGEVGEVEEGTPRAGVGADPASAVLGKGASSAVPEGAEDVRMAEPPTDGQQNPLPQVTQETRSAEDEIADGKQSSQPPSKEDLVAAFLKATASAAPPGPTEADPSSAAAAVSSSGSTSNAAPNPASTSSTTAPAAPSTASTSMNGELQITEKDVADAVAFLASATLQADRGQLAKIAGEMPRRQRSPYVKWSKEEDELLTRAVAKYGQKWDLVQKALPSRGYHQVRQRWLRKLGVFDNNKPSGGPGSSPPTPSPGPSTSTYASPHAHSPLSAYQAGQGNLLAQLASQVSGSSAGSPSPTLGVRARRASGEMSEEGRGLLFPAPARPRTESGGKADGDAPAAQPAVDGT